MENKQNNIMENKTQLLNRVRDWVRIDGEINTLQKEISKRRNDKKLISKELIDVMRHMEIDCFDLKDDGQLIYKKTTTKKPINKTSLLNILSTYFQGNSEKAEELQSFILNNREDIVNEKLVRK